MSLPLTGVLSTRGTMHAAPVVDGRAGLTLCGRLAGQWPERRQWDADHRGVCEVCRRIAERYP
jgi:hypothetical protein